MESFKYKKERVIKFKPNIMVQLPPDVKKEDVKLYQVHVEGMQVSPFRIRVFGTMDKAAEYIELLKSRGIDFRVSMIVDLASSI